MTSGILYPFIVNYGKPTCTSVYIRKKNKLRKDSNEFVPIYKNIHLIRIIYINLDA